jgi:hypothetical protein
VARHGVSARVKLLCGRAARVAGFAVQFRGAFFRGVKQFFVVERRHLLQQMTRHLDGLFYGDALYQRLDVESWFLECQLLLAHLTCIGEASQARLVRLPELHGRVSANALGSLRWAALDYSCTPLLVLRAPPIGHRIFTFLALLLQEMRTAHLRNSGGHHEVGSVLYIADVGLIMAPKGLRLVSQVLHAGNL